MACKHGRIHRYWVHRGFWLLHTSYAPPQQREALSVRVFCQSASIVPRCIHAVVSSAWSTKTKATLKKVNYQTSTRKISRTLNCLYSNKQHTILEQFPIWQYFTSTHWPNKKNCTTIRLFTARHFPSLLHTYLVLACLIKRVCLFRAETQWSEPNMVCKHREY